MMMFVANLQCEMNIRQVSVWVTKLKSGIRKRTLDRPRGFVGYPGGQWRTCGVESRQQSPSLRMSRKRSTCASVAPSIHRHLGTVEAGNKYLNNCNETLFGFKLLLGQAIMSMNWTPCWSQFTVGPGTANLLAPCRAVWVSISHQNTCCQEQLARLDRFARFYAWESSDYPLR